MMEGGFGKCCGWFYKYYVSYTEIEKLLHEITVKLTIWNPTVVCGALLFDMECDTASIGYLIDIIIVNLFFLWLIIYTIQINSQIFSFIHYPFLINCCNQNLDDKGKQISNHHGLTSTPTNLV